MGPQVLLLGGKEDFVASEPERDGGQPYDERVVVELLPVLRRVVGARIKDPHTVDDLVQETIARLMSSSSRVDPDKLHHYAAVTARHVVASYAERNDRARDRSHLLHEAVEVEPPSDGLLRQEDRAFVSAAPTPSWRCPATCWPACAPPPRLPPAAPTTRCCCPSSRCWPSA